jgi:hypothetical protein
MADESERDRVLHRVLGHVPPDRTSVPSDDRTVHVLHEGRALCGKPGVPGSWGPGHKWVRRDSDEGGPRSAVNCPGCIAAWSKWADTGTWDPFEPEPEPITPDDHDRAVLAALRDIPAETLQHWIDRHFMTVVPLAQRELARRRVAWAVPPTVEVDHDGRARALVARADRGEGRQDVKLVVDYLRRINHEGGEALLADLAKTVTKVELPRTRELLRRFAAQWSEPHTRPDVALLREVVDAFEAEDIEE